MKNMTIIYSVTIEDDVVILSSALYHTFYISSQHTDSLNITINKDDRDKVQAIATLLFEGDELERARNVLNVPIWETNT